MPVLKVYPNGFTVGTPPSVTCKNPPKRGRTQGWTPAATRRNTAFLYSVRADRLTGVGVAASLTVRECPESPEAFCAVRNAFIERLRRLGAVRFHWVVEMQERGVPHLHATIYFEPESYRGFPYPPEFAVRDAWLGAAAALAAGEAGQHVERIDGPVGWFRYQSKHASRGAKHYQRARSSFPESWQSNTGRVWGRGGDWPTMDPVELGLQNRRRGGDRGYFVFRRLVRRWRLADARSDPVAGNRPGRILAARRCGNSWNRGLSEVRGMSEWAEPEAVTLELVRAVAALGYKVAG